MSATPPFPTGGVAVPALLDRLALALPRSAILVGDAIDTRYQEDRRDKPSARPRFVVRPSSTAEVAACLAACNACFQPVVVHGGRTGLSGGHRIIEGEAVLSTERLTALGEVQRPGSTILASAGTQLQLVQEAADAAGLSFGVDLGARGSATIGGNVATNAGGIRVLRYGMFRAQVAGLEAVLADGTVVSSLRGLEKDNAGYDLKHLFIGSEGTLGVVTRVLLNLHPKPREEANALLALPSVGAAIQLMGRLRDALHGCLSAFEIMLPEAYDGAISYLGIRSPLETRAPCYVLAEVQSFHDDHAVERFSSALMQALEDGLALDATVSQSPREFTALWALRDSLADYVRTLNPVLGTDISLPAGAIEAFLASASGALHAIDPAVALIVFGHLGDGNLHYVVRTAAMGEAMAAVYRLVADHGGSIAAEHGIGVDKKPWLHMSRSEAEIGMMRRLKRALDPNLILNRGRVFDPAVAAGRPQ